MNLPLFIILINLSVFIISFTYLESLSRYESMLLNQAFSKIISLTLFWTLVVLILIKNINVFCFEFITCQTRFSNLIIGFILINGFVWTLTTSLIFNTFYNTELCILVLFCFLSYITLIYANDLNLIYIFLEIQSLVFYLFSGFKRTSEFSIEASLKYFIIGGAVSCFLLFSFALFYGSYGITNLNDLYFMFSLGFYYNSIKSEILLAIIFFSLTMHFKLNTVPLHFWSPSIYESVNVLIFWHFMIFPKIISIFFMVKLISVFNISWNNYILWLVLTGILSLCFGGLGAYYQLKWKRFFLYSGIHHTGFLLLSLIKFSYLNYFALSFYVIIYILTLQGALLTFLTLQTQRLTYILPFRYLKSLNFLYKFNPILSFVLTCLLFSLSGMPPFPGFTSKLLILFSLILNNFYFNALLVIFISFFVCYYYLKIVKQMWFACGLVKQIYFIQISKFQSNILAFVLSIFGFFSYFPDSLNFFIEVFLLNLIYHV